MEYKLTLKNHKNASISYKNLRCVYCFKLLSVGPVYYGESVGNVCGRCVKDVKVLISLKVLRPATTYESIAKHLEFPCSNIAKTCPNLLKWDEVVAHEITCKSTTKCPMINCAVHMDIELIGKHLLDNHKDHYKLYGANLSCQLFDRSQQCFTKHFHHMFLFNILPVSSDKLGYSVKCVPKVNAFDFQLYKHDIKVLCNEHGVTSSHNEIELKELSCASYRYLNIKKNNVLCNCHWFGLTITINIFKNFKPVDADLHHYFVSDMSLSKQAVIDLLDKHLEIEIPQPLPLIPVQVNEDDLNTKFLAELECPVCLNSMKPPIYNCTEGHSICKKCKSVINKCVMCRSELTNVRNFPLERLSGLLRYPCKFTELGCLQKFNEDNMKQHVLICFYRRLPCPICQEKICILRLMYHLEEIHPALQFYTNDLQVKFLTAQRSTCTYTVLNEKLFICKFQCDGESVPIEFDCVQVCMNEEDCKDKYKFQLQLFGANGLNFVMEHFCKNDIVQLGNDPLVLPVHQLKLFITKDPNVSITFRFVISKC